MNVNLFTTDSTVSQACRKVLSELHGGPWTLEVLDPGEWGVATGEQDICIWDFDPERPLPEFEPRHFAKRIFLVDQVNIVRFHQLSQGQPTAVVLKPITKGRLDAFLSLDSVQREVGDPTSLRADRDEILQCLIQTNLKLQQYDHDRTTFLTRAIHDFRAPLTALSGYCDFLLGELLGPLGENQKEVVRRMQHSAKRLSRMVAGMFQLSVGRQVRLGPALSRGDLRDCVEQAIHEVTPFADEKRIAITVDFADPGLDLYFDAKQMEQVFINLLDNACKFTPKAGSIEIRGYPTFLERRSARTPMDLPQERRRATSTAPNVYRVDVCDSGAPIPADQLERIFEEYVSYAGVADRGGAGLGLAICHMIVSQHEGRIWAENNGTGPVFSFVLPIRSHKIQRLSTTATPQYSEAV